MIAPFVRKSFVVFVPFLVLSVAFLSTISTAEPISFQYCDDKSEAQCSVSGADITPCHKYGNNNACKFKSNDTASLTFNYVPHWAPGSGKILSRVFCVWLLDLPYAAMDPDACKYTSCPLAKDVQNSYNYTMTFSSYPPSTYDVKFKIWEEDAKPEHRCCVIVKVQIVK